LWKTESTVGAAGAARVGVVVEIFFGGTTTGDEGKARAGGVG
jgi:hypothetical protein